LVLRSDKTVRAWGGLYHPMRHGLDQRGPLVYVRQPYSRIAMKKTFDLTHPKIKTARLVEAVRHEIKKYVKRERNKARPEGVDFWDFDCRFGHTEDVAKVVHLSDIKKCIDEAEKLQLTSFYVEILAKAGRRRKKP